MIATAVTIPVVLILAVILYLIARTRADESGAAPPTSSTDQATLPAVTVSPVPRTEAADKYCPDFLAKLPDPLDGLPRREVDAQNAYVQAFGNPAVVVQCGVPRPAGFVVGSQPILITGPHQQHGVQWFLDGTTSTAVDRDVYVAVTVPEGGDLQGVLQELTTVVGEVLPERPIDPAPAPASPGASAPTPSTGAGPSPAATTPSAS